MKIDIIICTYNRPQKIFYLANYLVNDNIANLSRIIIVDSSDLVNNNLSTLDKVKYLHSSHKNQPYQRYLGFMQSKADVVVYLDDDMELISKRVFKDLENIFYDSSVVGLAINFKDKNINNSLSKVPVSINRKTNILISKFFRSISLNSIPEKGQISLFGLRGEQPNHLMETAIISGGAFAARRSMLFSNFNFQLFELFERKIGMGEDTLIGYGLSKTGKILFYEPVCFLHNDEAGSNYSLDLIAYSKRVIYSRLYIALEKARFDKKMSFFIYLKYMWYVFFRVLGSFFSLILRPGKSEFKVFRGIVLGFFESFKLNYSFSQKRNSYWLSELESNVQIYKSRNVD
jgi:glycosyltransferase involved in cell wall biosynthesis